MNFEDLIVSIEQSADCDESHIFDLLKVYFNVTHITYVCPDLRPGKCTHSGCYSECDSKFISASTYLPEWQAHYLKSGYLDCDLAVKLSFERMLPVDWTKIIIDNPSQRKLFGEARGNYHFNVGKAISGG